MIRSEGLVAERRPRRRHVLSEKRRIVELTFEPGASVAQVAQAKRGKREPGFSRVSFRIDRVASGHHISSLHDCR